MAAKEQLRHKGQLQREISSEVSRHRTDYSSLRAQFIPTRTVLLNSLSSIFPIELLSPPDLLYTILDVPLPIPLSPKDPAPPLAVQSHKEVTEEAIAAALGYAAQVVHLLAGYLRKDLIYPITCISSRSLIRDDISAMVGPRMFPLYAKGVEVYRFEYGVFLLNKDIELLMADRDLRALDMRHTLPNLKNLLLTLTDGEIAFLRRPRLQSDSMVYQVQDPESFSGDTSASLDSSEAGARPPTNSIQSTTPPTSDSGGTTPTATTMNRDVSRKTRPLFNLPPLAGLFRTYNLSGVSQSTDCANESSPGKHLVDSIVVDDDDTGDEDEDRRTISRLPRDADQKTISGDATLSKEEEKAHHTRTETLRKSLQST